MPEYELNANYIISTELYLYSSGAQAIAAIVGLLFAAGVWRNQYLDSKRSKVSAQLNQAINRHLALILDPEPEDPEEKARHHQAIEAVLQEIRDRGDYLNTQFDKRDNANKTLLWLTYAGLFLIITSLMLITTAADTRLAPISHLAIRWLYIAFIFGFLFSVGVWANTVFFRFGKDDPDDAPDEE